MSIQGQAREYDGRLIKKGAVSWGHDFLASILAEPYLLLPNNFQLLPFNPNLASNTSVITLVGLC